MEIKQPALSPPPREFDRVALPGAIVSNAWPQARAKEGDTLRALETVMAQFPFFAAFQTLDVPYPAERRAIAQLLQKQPAPWSYTLTRLLNEKGANLSSLDPANRQLAIALALECLDQAEEAGSKILAFISGARPADPAQRPAALRALESSLEVLAAAAARRPGFVLLIEPLDYEAHKRNTLGSTGEAVAICRRLAGSAVRLCLDTSHLILNGEDVVAAVEQARGFVAEFHFCNPVLDRASPLYGDQHPPFGPPGVVDTEQVAAILAGLYRAGYLSTADRPRVFAEVMKPDRLESVAVMAHCQDVLRSGWNRAREILTS